MPIEMKQVSSSQVWQIGYDPDEMILQVRFRPSVKHPAGRVVRYLVVDPQTADNVMNAPSVGTALNDFVKGAFEFE